MKKISAPMTFFYKRVFPVLWFGFIALFVVIGSYVAMTTGRIAEAAPAVLVPLGMAAVGVFVFRKLLSGLADEVFDAGDALVVRNRGEEERVLLSNVKKRELPALRESAEDHALVAESLSLRGGSFFHPEGAVRGGILREERNGGRADQSGGRSPDII